MNLQQEGSSLDLQLFAGRLRSMVPPTKGNAGNAPLGAGNTGMSLRSGKVLATIACALILLLQLVAMSKWPNIRGIHDDLCYLRQAHLFQTLGVHGLNTDITLDTDNYFRDLIKPVVPDGTPVCHPSSNPNGHRVLQFPPGPGFLLSLFPDGNRGRDLTMAMTIAVFLLSVAAIWRARTPYTVLGCGVFGFLSIYFMINPIKGSYSVPPTVVICAVIGLLTSRLALLKQQTSKLLTLATIGLLLGFLFNLRIANVLLLTGYAAMLLTGFINRRDLSSFFEGATLLAAYIVGAMPTLIAQHINAGSAFSTTYGTGDQVPPQLTLETLIYYTTSTQGTLTFIAIGWAAYMIIKSKLVDQRRVAWATLINCAVTFTFFVFRPIPLVMPYYLIPVAALSLWTLLSLHLYCAPRAGTAPS